MTGPESPPPTSGWLDRAIDVFFVAVTVLAAARTPDGGTLLAGVGLLGLYACRFLLVGHQRLTPVWLGVLTLGWTAIVALVSVDFVWVSVPLLFLHLLLLPLGPAFAVVAAIVGVVILAEALEDGLVAAEVAGPLLGAGFAIVACVSYRRLATEHLVTRRALDDLEAARFELARSEHQRGMLDERRRVAREVHDTIAQDLASILLLARSPHSPSTATRVEDLAATALDEARRIVDALGPIELETTSLPAALARLGTAPGPDGPAIDVSVSGTPRDLPQPLEAMLLRVAQGALANSVEHARATTVFITLSYLDDEVTIDVVDDGCGFELAADTDTSRPGHFGLAVMQQRAEQVGGQLVIESGLGSGTAIQAVVHSP